MKKEILAGILAMVVLTAGVAPVMAAAFTGEADDLAAAMLKTTIQNLDMGNEFMDILNNATASTNWPSGEPLFQNLWGVVYGALVLTGWNNQITALVLDEIAANDTLSVRVGLAFSYLGSNATTVFGPMNGTAGIAMILNNQTQILSNDSWVYDSASGMTYLEAYADVLSDTIMHNVVFMTKLFGNFTNAWT